jgi:diguanylate cyclase (GGDEF)-like protein
VAVVLINPDQLGQLNAQFGLEPVDRALDELDRIVAATFTGEQLVAPVAERSYLLLLPGLTVRQALSVVERCRQQMDTTWFERNGARFRVTISCAVTEARQPDEAAVAADRLEAMQHEAKRYGRNRTFIQDGPHPSPAVLPSLALEPRTITV